MRFECRTRQLLNPAFIQADNLNTLELSLRNTTLFTFRITTGYTACMRISDFVTLALGCSMRSGWGRSTACCLLLIRSAIRLGSEFGVISSVVDQLWSISIPFPFKSGAALPKTSGAASPGNHILRASRLTTKIRDLRLSLSLILTYYHLLFRDSVETF